MNRILVQHSMTEFLCYHLTQTIYLITATIMVAKSATVVELDIGHFLTKIDIFDFGWTKYPNKKLF